MIFFNKNNLKSESMWAWITAEGENMQRQNAIYRSNYKGEYVIGKYKMNYYACKDLPGEKVIAYHVSDTNDREKVSLHFSDRQLNTRTVSGKKCSGEVSHYLGVAYEI